MLIRFCLYSVLKNLRFADPFLLLFMLDIGYSYAQIGLLLGFGRLITALFEVPSGIAADRWGRRRALAVCFLFYSGAFVLYPYAASRDYLYRLPWLYVATVLFGLAEAFRTGSHKAIMLDWLDTNFESHRTTAIIGLTRSFSKYTSALAAFVGGLLLFYTREYDWLFYLSAISSASGFALMLTYPRELEGEQRREKDQGSSSRRLSLRQRVALMTIAPGMLYLFFQSILFESQTSLMLKYYLQPFLKEGLHNLGFLIVGTGALWVGMNELVRNSLGGLGAAFSTTLEKGAGGGARALRVAYGLCFLLSIAVCICVLGGSMLLGLAIFIILTMLQNVRRPIFLSMFNQFMDKPQRATTLSIESQSRSLLIAALLPISGWAADRYGLIAFFTITSGMLALGFLLRFLRPLPKAVAPASGS